MANVGAAQAASQDIVQTLIRVISCRQPPLPKCNSKLQTWRQQEVHHQLRLRHSTNGNGNSHIPLAVINNTDKEAAVTMVVAVAAVAAKVQAVAKAVKVGQGTNSLERAGQTSSKAGKRTQTRTSDHVRIMSSNTNTRLLLDMWA